MKKMMKNVISIKKRKSKKLHIWDAKCCIVQMKYSLFHFFFFGEWTKSNSVLYLKDLRT